MKLLTRISIPAHGLIELIVGLALIVASMALTLGTAGTILTFAAGGLLAGLGLGTADTFSLAAHRSLDRLTAILLAAASVAAALTGDRTAALLLLACGAGLLALSAFTRWTRPPLHAPVRG